MPRERSILIGARHKINQLQFILIVIAAAIAGTVIGAWGFWTIFVGGIVLSGYRGDIRFKRKEPTDRKHNN